MKDAPKFGGWVACRTEGCHCQQDGPKGEMLHVETPYGTMYGPREAMDLVLKLAAAAASSRTLRHCLTESKLLEK